MKVTNLGRLSVFLFALLCGSAVCASGQFCVHCDCTAGHHCSCPVCEDHFPGQCASLGCQKGFSCCFITSCGNCECNECNPSFCLATGTQCTIDGCPFSPTAVVENIDANNHLQPWMVDETLPTQLAAYSKTWSVVVARLQHDFSDTTLPLATRRKLLLPNITHAELALPDYTESVVVETKYSAQKGGWVFRLVRGLKGDKSRADILVIMPHVWSLHREEPSEHIGDGKIAPMPSVLDFPKDENVEAQAAARLAKAQAAKDKEATPPLDKGAPTGSNLR
jgi:hypothetical protein